MNEQQNIDLIRQAYDAYGCGDLDRLLDCMDPAIDWELPAVPGLAFTGKRHGRDEVAEYFRLASEKQQMRGFEARDFIAQGDKVIVLGHGAWTAKDTGQDFASDWVHVFTVRDGRIQAFREFMDAHVAVEAFGRFPLSAQADGQVYPAPH
jgi:ketosteroid isomerase-like protein